MKKISILLAILMVFSAFSGTIHAEGAVTEVSPYITKTSDNTFELLLRLGEGAPVAGGRFNVVYDSAKLTYVNHEVKDALAATLNVVNPQYNANAIRVLWAGTKDMSAGGELIRIEFEVKENASGRTEIVLDKLKLMDIESVEIPSSCDRVKITLSDGIISNLNGSSGAQEKEDADEEERETPDDSELNTDTDAGNENKPGVGGEESEESTEESNTSTSSSNHSSGGHSSRYEKEEKVPVKDETEEKAEGEDKYAQFAPEFTDVKETDWFFESVKFAKFHSLMSGVSEKEFAPSGSLTRGMLVTILYRLEGEPQCGDSAFEDVEDGMWYKTPISWAAERKVVNGVGDNKFAPDANITREQIALIMYNYSEMKGLDVTESKSADEFSDGENVSQWAKDAVEWATGASLLSGKGEGILDPKGNATRAEIATVLMRYIEKYYM